MTKTAMVLIPFLALGACAYTPTAPTPYVEPPPRVATQLSIRIAGPDTWWADRLFAVVTAYDEKGAETNALVACASTDGIWEPSAFETFSRKGVLVRGVKAGSVLVCRYQDAEASYAVTAGDWRLFCCGAPTPAPKPPVVPVPDSGGA